MMHEGRNQHWINEKWLDSRSDKERWLCLKEWSKRLLQATQRQLKGRRAGRGEASTFHNWTHGLVFCPYVFLQLGRHNLGHFLEKVPRKLSNMFHLGMFASLSKIRRMTALTGKVGEQGRVSTTSEPRGFGLAESQLFNHSSPFS